MAAFLRTPESRFDKLPGFPYQPQYITLPSSQGLRLAYIDEKTPNYNVGNPNSRVFLCLHGVPTWSYLYRKMIPVFLNSNNYHGNGVRVVCPDFIGWGRSDKPLSSTKHSIHNMMFHRESMFELIKSLNLTNITLVVQDWGGLIGLTLPFINNNEILSRFDRIILFNTAIPTGSDPGPGFMMWRAFVERTPDMDVGMLIKNALYPSLSRGNKKLSDLSGEQVSRMKEEECYVSEEELMCYIAPFPSEKYKYAIQKWPLNVPINENYEGMNIWKKALKFWLKNKNNGEKKENSTGNNKYIKVFMAHGMQDPIFSFNGAIEYMYKIMVPFSNKFNPELGMSLHCGGILWVPYGGHFLQVAHELNIDSSLTNFF